MTERTALILGGSKGLGFACAKSLSKKYKIILVSRNKKNLKNAKDKILQNNNQAVVKIVICNITKKKDRKRLFKKIKNIDILLSNTNGPKFGNILSLKNKIWERAFNDFFLSQKDIIENYLKVMKNNNWGRIIIISSVILKIPNSNLGLSQVLRSALSGLMVSLSKEAIKSNITINSILPGSFNTTRTADYIKISNKKTLLNNIPSKKLGSPKEVGHLSNYLASEYSSYITGQNISLDGGITTASFS